MFVSGFSRLKSPGVTYLNPKPDFENQRTRKPRFIVGIVRMLLPNKDRSLRSWGAVDHVGGSVRRVCHGTR